MNMPGKLCKSRARFGGVLTRLAAQSGLVEPAAAAHPQGAVAGGAGFQHRTGGGGHRREGGLVIEPQLKG